MLLLWHQKLLARCSVMLTAPNVCNHDCSGTAHIQFLVWCRAHPGISLQCQKVNNSVTNNHHWDLKVSSCATLNVMKSPLSSSQFVACVKMHRQRYFNGHSETSIHHSHMHSFPASIIISSGPKTLPYEQCVNYIACTVIQSADFPRANQKSWSWPKIFLKWLFLWKYSGSNIMFSECTVVVTCLNQQSPLTYKMWVKCEWWLCAGGEGLCLVVGW